MHTSSSRWSKTQPAYTYKHSVTFSSCLEIRFSGPRSSYQFPFSQFALPHSAAYGVMVVTKMQANIKRNFLKLILYNFFLLPVLFPEGSIEQSGSVDSSCKQEWGNKIKKRLGGRILRRAAVPSQSLCLLHCSFPINHHSHTHNL